MAITYVGTGAITTVLNSGASGTVALPAGVAAGDLLLLICGFGDGSSLSATPSGWTAGGGGSPPNSFSGQPYFYWKIAGASEGSASVTTANNGGGRLETFGIMAFRGAHATTPVNVFAYNGTEQTPAAGGNITTPSATTTVASCALVGFIQETQNHTAAMSLPAGLTAGLSNSTTTALLTGYTLTSGAAGAYTAGTFTTSDAGRSFKSLTIAVAPAASAAGPTITTQPSNQSAATGATFTFTVAATASGGGALSYQWQKNGTNISGATSTSYSGVAGTDGANADAFRCVVTETGGTNAGSTNSNAATLTVTSGASGSDPRLIHSFGRSFGRSAFGIRR